MSNNIAIKLDNVSKRFNVYRRNIDRIKGVLFNREPKEVKHALNNVSLEIKKGERVMIFGIVDSGRSTLLKIISGISKPSKGKVFTYGTQNVMLDAKVGLDMEFSCRENIFLKGNLVGLSRAEVEPHVDDILKFAEIENYADLPMKRAPKGTAAMMSMAVHLLSDADIIVCDEVFGGGGNYVTSKCEQKLVEYFEKNENCTVLIASNRPVFAKAIAARTIVIDKGEIVFDGDAGEAWKIVSEISRNRGKKNNRNEGRE